VEPFLGEKGPEFVFHFPRQQASLAQVSEEGWAQRFEIYWKGVELGNAYLEVNSPEENVHVFERELALREAAGFKLASLDESFFQFLRHGMPPCCGIAIGLDRLFMLLNKEERV
ncbi:MAG: elongation factor P lysine(34) lysyltransferase, partial [Bdellovibrionales bacterium]|nr:hypothetical protein [Bdellovibrionales bacterium]NQZ20019.1 elongation factor P lysine(34) lysyltransferase [Bdellovibrionales bacterium]